MKRTLFLSLVSAGALLYIQPALAQSPGGMPLGQTPSTFPGRNIPGQAPGMNNPTAPSANTAPAKVDDKKFAKGAALDGLIAVELGKLASQKASRDDIKQFAQRIVDDYTKANDQLKAAAGKDKIQIPDSLDSKHQSRVDKLSKLSGENFDKAFVKEEVKDSEAEVIDYDHEVQGGKDPDVQVFASNMLPTIKQHLEAARNLNKPEKNTAKQPKGE